MKTPSKTEIVIPGKIIMNAEEKARRLALKRAPRPRIASTIVLLKGPKDKPKILMGQRSSKNDFMPSVFVFPGGRVERADSYAPYIGDLSPRTETILEAAYNPRKARAIVLASIRETFEETSLILGQPQDTIRNMKNAGWQALHDQGQIADLSGIEVFGRAVTPPHRHRRYDTWFFVKHLTGTPPPISDSAELSNVDWFSFDEIGKLDLQRATKMMLQVLEQYLALPSAPPRIFHSYQRGKTYFYKEFPA